LYEREEESPRFRGAPDDDAPYVWVCDAFYQVESGGRTQQLGDREVQVAFESPMPRGFETREAAIEAAKEHVKTQFARLGVPEAEVTIDVIEVAEAT
jgi:hypothetical protein